MLYASTDCILKIVCYVYHFRTLKPLTKMCIGNSFCLARPIVGIVTTDLSQNRCVCVFVYEGGGGTITQLNHLENILDKFLKKSKGLEEMG